MEVLLQYCGKSIDLVFRGWTGIGMEESKLRQNLKFRQDFPFFQPIPVQPLGQMKHWNKPEKLSRCFDNEMIVEM